MQSTPSSAKRAQKPVSDQNKQERLAKALRNNLRRRKLAEQSLSKQA